MKKRELKNESERFGVTPELTREYKDKLSKMINCKTVWTKDGVNDGEFERFYALIDELFPTLSARAKRLTFGGGCFFYVIEGKSAKRNILLMSHHDVVEGGEG